ncbi:MAG TPA: hypothetical protein VFO10_22945 [Oligoflexus sp.]|uniref:hypothetical protein n=1 Tax=Oligoflexus sp. TaxID=1971216 RepID=UPI002D806B0E|nr:hypothetical protein [Oligoflexus sp.]HET9240139.1 hypothetical protein [Oligoflexus sp.]
MKVWSLGLVFAALSIGCGEKKEEKTENIVQVKLPDGTGIELNKDRLYAESECELDNVLTSTYRKNWYSISRDYFVMWGLVFFNANCDTAQEHLVFGSPFTIGLKDFDGSKGTVDVNDDQKADYEITATEDQLTIHAVYDGNEEVDTVYAKSEDVFSTDRIFDFSLEVSTPTLTATQLDVEFKLALTTDDFLVNEASYLKSIYAETTCKLANGAIVHPMLPDETRDNRLDGAGTYKASAVLSANQKNSALKSCEVYLERVYEATDSGRSGAEIKSVEISL